MNAFEQSIIQTILQFITYLTMLGLTVFGLKWISSHKKDAIYAQIALMLIKNTLGSALGDKAGSVLDIWMNGLNNLSTNDNLQSTDNFVSYIQKSLPNTEFSDNELESIRTAAKACFELIRHDNSKQTVKMMMLDTLK